jgi:tripartite ATP-independent transporter DctP family solute receptor
MHKKTIAILAAATLFMSAHAESKLTLRYSHPNAPTSIAGQQADLFAKKVAEYSGGSITVEVYPSSQLGSLQEQAEQVSAGVVAFNHNTAAAMGTLFEDFAVLDTPFMYKDVSHLLKVADPNSGVMKKLNEGLLKKSKVRVLYTFYFGTRQLTADRPIKKPDDLKGLKIRSVPFPIYSTAVEGMGATPTPIDWAETVTSLKTKVVNGQENPVNTIASAKLWEVQSNLMMTNHIIGAEIVVVNDAIWQKLTPAQQSIIQKAAADASAFGTKTTLAQEATDLKTLKDNGMKIITAADGLDIAAFKARVDKLVNEKFGAKWVDYYTLIKATK